MTSDPQTGSQSETERPIKVIVRDRKILDRARYRALEAKVMETRRLLDWQQANFLEVRPYGARKA